MKRRKILICILLRLKFCPQVTPGSFFTPAKKIAIKVSILDVCYSLYLFCLGVTCVHLVERHSEFIWQLTTLTTVPAVLLLFSAITPDIQTSATPPLWFSRSVLLLHVVLPDDSDYTYSGTWMLIPTHFTGPGNWIAGFQ
ncbi:hypothetical protein C8R45DRAFT_243435 [Mycena sanguinolenta]|nr:hypothetical protein C8R45DRAFT_243435 [Mycena sanguinolenta]